MNDPYVPFPHLSPHDFQQLLLALLFGSKEQSAFLIHETALKEPRVVDWSKCSAEQEEGGSVSW